MTNRHHALNLRYKIVRQPSRALAPHNQSSYEKVKRYLDEHDGVASYRELEAAARGHVSGDTNKPSPAQFIDYLIKLGML